MQRRLTLLSALCALLVMTTNPAHASEKQGVATPVKKELCDEAPQNWQTMEQLVAQLKQQGWRILRTKVDEGCFEVYALNGEKQVEITYFNPRTFEPVLTKSR